MCHCEQIHVQMQNKTLSFWKSVFFSFLNPLNRSPGPRPNEFWPFLRANVNVYTQSLEKIKDAEAVRLSFSDFSFEFILQGA